jgi:hypothetical protein
VYQVSIDARLDEGMYPWRRMAPVKNYAKQLRSEESDETQDEGLVLREARV